MAQLFYKSLQRWKLYSICIEFANLVLAVENFNRLIVRKGFFALVASFSPVCRWFANEMHQEALTCWLPLAAHDKLPDLKSMS